jgi:GxxExxY protein
VPVSYKGLTIAEGYRADLLVENQIIVELKASETILPIHEAQLLTYLRMSKLEVGLLMNFHAPTLRQGLRRLILRPLPDDLQ